MEYINELLEKLEQSGKVEQFAVYKEIFSKCFENRDRVIFSHFDNFLVLLEEYISFDSKPDIRIRTLISENLEIFFSFIRNSNDLDAYKKYSPSYKKYEELISDELSKAKILQYIGYFKWMQQDFAGSINELEKSLKIVNEHCSPNEIPGRFTNLGYIYECSGEMDKAEYYYNEGLEFAKKHNSENSIKMAYSAMGRLFLSRSNYSKAIIYFEESLNLHDDDKELDRVAVICNLAISYSFNNEFTKAKNLFKQIRHNWIKEADPDLYYSSLVNSAINFDKLKDYKVAENLFLEAVIFAKSQNSFGLLSECYINLGSLYSNTERTELALDYYKKAMVNSEKINNQKELQIIFRNMGSIFQHKKQPQKAIKFIEKAIILSKKQKNNSSLLELLLMQSVCLKELKNFEKACNILEEYNTLKDEIWENQKKQEKELLDNPLVGHTKKSYVFRESNSLLSSELVHKIGSPFIGRNPAILKVIKQTLLAAGNSSAGILVRGESGTGKEIVAKMIHYSGLRADQPFVAVNSASFSSGIANSALFGHLKGAFTGASSRQIGHFEAADKGTIFFDEIGDMPLDIQSTLLRVLEEKEIHPLGSNNNKKIDFRMISATNIDIYEKVQKKEFRLDFLNRINTLEIIIPPLRERRDDISILTDYFLDEICSRLKVKRPTISASALKMLCDYDYPGNVRELRNTIEKLIIFSKNKEINSEDIYLMQNNDPNIIPINHNFPTLNLQKIETAVVKQAMSEADNVQVVAAKLLGITTSSMFRKLKKLGLS